MKRFHIFTTFFLYINVHESISTDFTIRYIQIDHDVVPRKIENINDSLPLPLGTRREFLGKKYPTVKKQTQDIILDIYNQRESLFSSNICWKNESEIHKLELKSVLGTNGEVYFDKDWGLMSAVLACYNNHWALRTGPEDWWTVVIRRIIQVMADYQHISYIRDFFVENKAEKKLSVNFGSNLKDINYNILFSAFSDEIKATIKSQDFMETIGNDFSVSTADQEMISNIVLISSVESYFDSGIYTFCGIPGVEMKGLEEDWLKLIDKLNRLESLLSPISKYLRIGDWFDKTKDIFVNLHKTYIGYPNIEWWSNIMAWNERWGSSGMRSYWSGWFPDFVGAGNIPEGYLHFPSDLVKVPVHISDFSTSPPVEDDGILLAGIVGFKVYDYSRAPIVEPQHAWSLLLPEESQVADRLTGYVSGMSRS